MNTEQRMITLTVLALFALGLGAMAARIHFAPGWLEPGLGGRAAANVQANRSAGDSSPDSGPGGWIRIFDLTRLPAGTQGALAIVLLLPVAALITAVFRNLIGVRTFGTFTPGLIALSFVQADWRTGLLIFALVLGVGLLIRLALHGFRLLMVSRLGILLTAVVLAMVLTISTLDYLAWTPSAVAVLLPMVIVTMIIERFHVCTEEDGLPTAARTLAATLLVALCCFLVMRTEAVSRTMLLFPEVLLLITAFLILIGRYTGYRISELWRFRDLTTPPGGPA